LLLQLPPVDCPLPFVIFGTKGCQGLSPPEMVAMTPCDAGSSQQSPETPRNLQVSEKGVMVKSLQDLARMHQANWRWKEGSLVL